MPVNFINQSPKVYINNAPEGFITPTLKPAVYTLEWNKDEGFFLLETCLGYHIPEKVYGSHIEGVKRVINSHTTGKNSTGVLLSGLKGTGKSLFVKIACNEMIKLGQPVIQINKAYHGHAIFNFIENIGNCAVLFDEFGKNYTKYDITENESPTQASLLSLFDGLTNSKRLHLFTENSIDLISEFMLNRPGRIRYHFKYDRLPLDVIREFAVDQGAPKDIVDELIELTPTIAVLSFDVIKCLIDEWLMYGGKLADHLEILNITKMKDPSQSQLHVVSYSVGGKEYDHKTVRAYASHRRVTIEGIKGAGAEEVYDNFYGDTAFKIEGSVRSHVTDQGGVIVIDYNYKGEQPVTQKQSGPSRPKLVVSSS